MLQAIQSTLIEAQPVPSTSMIAIGDVPSQVAYPYIVIRPIYTAPDERAVCGQSLTWGQQVGVYCVAQAPDASMYIAHNVIGALDGEMIDGAVLQAEATYSGSNVNGVFESLVTIRYEKGTIDAYL